MEGALKSHEEWDNTANRVVPPRIDASFTEIYELIFHNRTMVPSELDVLLQLVENKLSEKTRQVIGRN